MSLGTRVRSPITAAHVTVLLSRSHSDLDFALDYVGLPGRQTTGHASKNQTATYHPFQTEDISASKFASSGLEEDLRGA